jgi:cyanophycinase
MVIVGGGELPEGIRDRFLELAGGQAARLVIIPTASEKADQPELLKFMPQWRATDLASLVMLHTRRREEASDPDFLQPLKKATGVWFCGGDQSRLVAAYRGTGVETELRQLLRRGGVIGGTSAGAAVMSGLMITGGKQLAEIGPGFGFLPGVVIDQHFLNRQRQERLFSVLARFPACPGIGIDEQTAAIVHGHVLSVLGKAKVSICLSAVDAQAASVKALTSGDRLDLLDLCHTAQVRSRARAKAADKLPMAVGR